MARPKVGPCLACLKNCSAVWKPDGEGDRGRGETRDAEIDIQAYKALKTEEFFQCDEMPEGIEITSLKKD